MKNFIFGALAALCLSVVSNMVVADEVSLAVLKNNVLTKEPMSPEGVWDYVVDSQNELWIGYYDTQRLLRLRHPSGKEKLIVSDDRAQAPSGIEMAAYESGAAVLWRDKYPSKGLYLIDLKNIELPVEVDGDTEALARFSASYLGGKDRLLNLLWYGEKIGEVNGSPYNLYFRQLNLENNKLSPTALLMPGIYPVMSANEEGDLVVYSWIRDAGSSRIVARYKKALPFSEVEVPNFGDLVTIAEPPTIVPIFQSFTSGSRWFVIWLAQYGEDRRNFLLEGAYSDNPGLEKAWTRFSIDELRGYDIGSLQVAASPNGNIILAMMARPLSQNKDTKPDIYVLRSSDRGESWSRPYRLRRNAELAKEPLEHPLDAFNARYPSISFGEKSGEILVVWEDWRDIRSGIYASFSKDYGETWLANNVPLTRSLNKNFGLRYEPNAAYFADGKFHVIAEQLLTDAFAEKQLVDLSFSLDELVSLSDKNKELTGVVKERLKQRLKQRVDDFWLAMKKKDFEVAYDFQDPFFRARVSRADYLQRMGKILYAETELLDTKVNGALADVIVRIRASVPPFKSPKTAKTVTKKEREVPVTGHWLYVDGDWYREFYTESLDQVFTRY